MTSSAESKREWKESMKYCNRLGEWVSQLTREIRKCCQMAFRVLLGFAGHDFKVRLVCMAVYFSLAASGC